MVYEAAPLVLLRPPQRAAPVIRLDAAPRGGAEAATELPRPPDAGFFGRDETLLALDRAFDDSGRLAARVRRGREVLHGGGVRPLVRRDRRPRSPRASGVGAGAGAVVLVRASPDRGPVTAWPGITSPACWRRTASRGRRSPTPPSGDVVLQVLAQLPVLWIWDNVQPVTGFPGRAPPAPWTPAEQQQLTAGGLARPGPAHPGKVLLTSRRDERGWLGDVPARVRRLAMPMREGVQLAAALAARHGPAWPGRTGGRCCGTRRGTR